ncbi:hypothetical protein ACVMAJ_000116 [Bradyrhizobium sp. USDA 4448]
MTRSRSCGPYFIALGPRKSANLLIPQAWVRGGRGACDGGTFLQDCWRRQRPPRCELPSQTGSTGWRFAIISSGCRGGPLRSAYSTAYLVADGYFAEDRPERYAEIARKAVQAKPDVIVVSWDNQLLAQVAKETSTIPILWQMPSLDAGFVRNPARPEGNITGFAFDAGTEMQGKHLDILPSCPICVPYRLSLKPLRLGRDLGACGCPGWAQFGHFNYRHTDGPLGRGRGLSSSI